MPKLPRLRAVRERKAITQEELATKAKVSRATIGRIESGEDTFVTTARKLAAALEVEPGALMGPEEAKIEAVA